MYRNIKQSGFDLPHAIQSMAKEKYVKTVTGVLAVLLVSGCVSQQSALDFGGTPAVQPVPTGVSLAGDPSANIADPNQTLTTTTTSNIPTKAPRPELAVTQTAAVQQTDVQANTTQAVATVATTETNAESTLAIAEATPQPATANVIAAATQPQATGTQAALATSQVESTSPPIPQPKPATAEQTQQNVEVASLSPAVESAPVIEAPEAEAVKKKSFFERLFTPKEKKPRPSVGVNKPKIQEPVRASSRITTAKSVADRPTSNASKLKTQRPKKIVASVRASQANEGGALPGVKSNNEIFGIKNEGADTSRTTQVAAVGSFGRLSPNGLRVQHSKVQVACLKPGVLRILKVVERHYGKKPIITSGYRSPKRNRRAGGARNSQHIFCKAVDIQVEGVSKWKLAKFLRTVPGRGGVGTYCRTKSVHFDIGSKRDWHHPCRKSSKRKRKKA